VASPRNALPLSRDYASTSIEAEDSWKYSRDGVEWNTVYGFHSWNDNRVGWEPDSFAKSGMQSDSMPTIYPSRSLFG